MFHHRCVPLTYWAATGNILFSWAVKRAQSIDVLYVKNTLHVSVCQQSATVCTFSGGSPAELSFKSLHKIVLFYQLCSRDWWWLMCWNHCLYVFTTFLTGKYKKSTKRCTYSFSWEISLCSASGGPFMSQYIHPTLYEWEVEAVINRSGRKTWMG